MRLDGKIRKGLLERFMNSQLGDALGTVPPLIPLSEPERTWS